MGRDIEVNCDCGAFRSVVRDFSAGNSTRVVCYCKGCQSFPHYLGKADSVLDEQGGTDICQITPDRLEILQGAEQLACVRQTEKGALRWYTACCKTPIGNTLMGPGVPFLGWIHRGAVSDDVRPLMARTKTETARGDVSQLNPGNASMFRVLPRFARLILGARFSGRWKRTPFFDIDSGKPVVKPEFLTLEQYRALLPD